MSNATGRFLLLSLIVALLAGLVLTPGLPGAFVFDDIPNIVNNEGIKLTRLDANGVFNVISSWQPSGSMRVLPTLSFALDFWRAGGAEAEAFKITNIVIHALTACALAWFFRSLLLISGVPGGRARWLAPALALAWALHPLQVSSVLYVVQRIQTMGTLFLVLALWMYLTARQSQIEGRPGRTSLLLAALMWVAAMGCKEDSVLLPAYTLALELTVLRFAASSSLITRNLRRGYLIATLSGAAIYALWVIPNSWNWEAYPGRDFSSLERLLTQGRVLCLYMWQIVLPLPQNMPFYYDWLQPSRGLLQPWTTLPAILGLAALLGIAWWLRTRWPVFALGVFVFFSAHFIASNVVGLELAYEHRNNFALIGAVLAMGSLLAHANLHVQVRPAIKTTLCATLLVALGGATILRAHTWRNELSLAHTSTNLAPNSARAWISLCATYFHKGGDAVLNNPFLDEAIEACTNGAELAPDSLNNPMLLVVLKTLRGDVTPKDWALVQQRLETVQMSWDNARAPQILTHFAREGVKLDRSQLIKALATLARRAPLDSFKLANIGYFIMGDLDEPDVAFPYFVRAMEASPADDPFPQQLSAELKQKGRPDLAEKIERIAWARLTKAAISGE